MGAECVSSARSDLSGGRGVTRVPTGMEVRVGQLTWKSVVNGTTTGGMTPWNAGTILVSWVETRLRSYYVTRQ